MRRNKLFGWLTGFASVAMAAGISMAPVLAAVSENTPGGGNPGPVEEVVNGEDENLDAAGQEEQVDEDVGRIAGENETEENKADGETGKNLDGAIARGASGEDGDTETSGVYEFKDNKTTGTVTVVEKWDDQSNNAERPAVDISLSTAKPSKSPLGYTVTFHADAEKGLAFADGSTENEVVYNSSGQVVSGAYKGLTGGSGVVRWYTDKTYQTRIELDENGQLTGILTGDMDAWPKEVTFEVKGYTNSENGFRKAIPNTATTVVFTDEAMPAGAASIDVDADGDGGVVAWTEKNGTVMKVSTQIAGVKVQAANDSGQMFYYKSEIQTIDFTNLDTANVRNMNSMFSGCSGLTSLDLSSFDTANVSSMRDMFYVCSELTSLDLSAFDTANVTNMGCMFHSCRKLNSLSLSSLDTSKVASMYQMFDGCSGLTSLDLSPLDTSKVTNMSYMFNGCSGLTSLDLSAFDTANVSSMMYMFYDCSGLTSLDLSAFDTANVSSMSSMFSGCSGLTSLDLSPLDTSKVTYMGSMFSGCNGLTSLDLSPLDTSKVTSMSSMFSNCIGLRSLDLSSFDTANVQSMGSMFRGCSGLTSLDLSPLDTFKVTDMSYMFNGCSGLTSLNLSQLDTSKVTSMYSIFSGCSGLTSLDLSQLDTANVRNMNSMFYNCYRLTSLDLSPLDTSKVMSMSSMFKGCGGLTTLTTGTNFRFVGTNYTLPGTWKNTAGETFTSGTFPSNVADTYTKIAS